MPPTRPALAITLALLTSPTFSAWGGPAGFDPEAYLPKDAAGVIVVRDPAATLGRAEALAAAIGAAPPQAGPGWLLALDEEGALAAVDLAKPAYLAFMDFPGAEGRTGGQGRAAKRKGSSGTSSVFEGVLVLGLKGDPRAISSGFPRGTRTLVKDGWLVVSTLPGKGPLRPSPRRFELPRGARAALGGSDLVLQFDPARLPRSEPASGRGRSGADGGSREKALGEAGQRLAEQLQAMGGFQGRATVGLSLRPGGVEMLTHLDGKGPLFDALRGAEASSGSLVGALPPDDYVLIVAGRSDPAGARAALDVWAPVARAMAGGDARLEKLVDSALTTLGDPGRGCTDHAFGAALPAGLESTSFVGVSRCPDARKADGAWGALSGLLNQASAAVEPKGGWALKTEKGPSVGGVAFESIALVAPGGAGAQEADSALLRAPLLHGVLDARTALYAWNASPALVGRLVSAARAPTRDVAPSLRATEALLLRPRILEGYLRVGPVAASFMGPELAPLRMLLGTLPPLGFAARAAEDGALLYQVWLPKELAQLAVAAAQLDPRAGGGGPPADQDSSGPASGSADDEEI